MSCNARVPLSDPRKSRCCADWIVGAYSRYLYERMGFALIFKLPAHLGLRYWLLRKDLA